MADKCIIG
jgi:hypothetical protein